MQASHLKGCNCICKNVALPQSCRLQMCMCRSYLEQGNTCMDIAQLTRAETAHMGAPGSASVCEDSNISCCLAQENDASIVFDLEVSETANAATLSVYAASRCKTAAQDRDSPRANRSGYASEICTATAKAFAGLQCLKFGSCECKGASGACEDLKGEGTDQINDNMIKEAAKKDKAPVAMPILGAPHLQESF